MQGTIQGIGDQDLSAATWSFFFVEETWSC